MTRAESYTKKVEDWLTPVLSPMGFELVDVEYVKEAGTWYLRVYIDKEGGITVDDWAAGYTPTTDGEALDVNVL